MTKKQSEKFSGDINGLGNGYRAETEFIPSTYSPGHPFGVKVVHAETGNEVAFANTPSESKYIIQQMESK